MATHYSMAHPTRVERLALVGPAGLVSRQHTRWLLSAILANGVRPTPARVASFVDSMAMPATRPRLREDPWRLVVRQFVEGIPNYRSRLDEPIPRRAMLSRLAAADFPVLVLVGRQESLHDGTLMARRFTEQVPRAHVELLDDANHLIFIDRTDAVADHLRAFLAGGVGNSRA
jgi:pimeloyl-ACP methyl ester carboxylesterase